MRTHTQHRQQSRFPRRYKYVPGEGPIPAKVMLIGERPGQVEAERGRPFCGPAGELLDTMLAAANLDRDKIYITNLVKTFHEYDKPTREEIAAGLEELNCEVVQVKPSVIGLLGTFAVEGFTGVSRAELEKTHGVPVQMLICRNCGYHRK